jgi:ferric-dicitrate binding protein FerR (iron transport regulator)
MEKKEIFLIVLQFFDDTLPRKYRAFVKRWLLDKKNRKEKDEALYFIWSHIDAKPNRNTHQALHRMHCRLGMQSSLPSSIRSYMKYAAIVLLLFSATLGAWKFVDKIEHQREKLEICDVPNGQVKTIYLSDGSIVKLNSGSSVKYPQYFKKDRREVYLQGEAVFSVKHNPSQPFMVHVGNLTIKDVGTRFNVRAYQPHLVITTLAEGRVCEYEDKAGRSACINLVPGEQSVFCANTHKFTKKRVDADDYMAWTEGNLVFRQSPLNSVIMDIAHHFNVKVDVGKDIPKNQLFTTQFRSSESLTDVLEVLSKMGNFRYSTKGDRVYLNKK